jgi:hypothetical protein
MKILEYRPSKETAFLIHAVFFNFYCLLIGRAVLVISGIHLDRRDVSTWQRRLMALEKLSNVILFSVGLESSYTSFRPDDVLYEDIFISLFCATTAFLTIHRGMFMDVTPKPEASWADKVLKVCRAIFFLLGSLLLVLMLIRMGYALYQQFHPSEFRLISIPKN